MTCKDYPVWSLTCCHPAILKTGNGSDIDLRIIYTSDFEASGLMWALALLMMAWMVWSISEFPRWLSGLIALNSIIGLASIALMFAMGKYEPPVLGEVLLMVVFFAIAAVFWRNRSVSTAALP